MHELMFGLMLVLILIVILYSDNIARSLMSFRRAIDARFEGMVSERSYMKYYNGYLMPGPVDYSRPIMKLNEIENSTIGDFKYKLGQTTDPLVK